MEKFRRGDMDMGARGTRFEMGKMRERKKGGTMGNGIKDKGGRRGG